MIDKTVAVVSAYLSSNPIAPADVPGFIASVHTALVAAEAGTSTVASDEPPAPYLPAVSVRSSVKPDHLVSLIDGKKYKTLKRHLAGHGLTPDQYRERYGLKSDYPMVAPNYAEVRRELAKKIGLGRAPTSRRRGK